MRKTRSVTLHSPGIAGEFLHPSVGVRRPERQGARHLHGFAMTFACDFRVLYSGNSRPGAEIGRQA